MTTELTLPQRAAVALNSSQHEAELLALSKKYADITEIVNSAGRDQAHGAMMELANRRVAITKAGKDARDDATKFSKAIIEEERRLVGLIEPEEGRLRSLRDAWDAEREREKQAKAAAEKARVDGIRQSIDGIRSYAANAVGKSSVQIAAMIETIEAVEITLELYQEFSGEAEVSKIQTVQKLGEMLTAQLAAEEEAKRLQLEREELAKLRAEAAERERQAEAARREQEARDRAERERVEAEQRAAIEKAEAAMRAEREAHEARLKAEREAAEAELRKQREELARQQAEIAHAKAEQERKEREAREAAEAEARAKREAEEAAARAEAARIEAERRAAEQEQIRREREQFAINGPGDVEIVKLLANHYGVTLGDAMQWMKKFDYAAADEYFAAANVAANQMEKAA